MPNHSSLEQYDFWLPGHFRVFISHISRYKESAAKLQAAFIPHYISSFVAHNDIQPTREWETEIKRALSSSDAIVVLLHKGFHEKITGQRIAAARSAHLGFDLCCAAGRNRRT